MDLCKLTGGQTEWNVKQNAKNHFKNAPAKAPYIGCVVRKQPLKKQHCYITKNTICLLATGSTVKVKSQVNLLTDILHLVLEKTSSAKFTVTLDYTFKLLWGT